jgi:protein-L-isoaspartate O-methyltransferase
VVVVNTLLEFVRLPDPDRHQNLGGAMDQASLLVFRVFGEDVRLERADGVFMPSPHGLFYASVSRVEPGERVIDIGTGSGILGIAAAKRGAQVVATDIDARAVVAAEKNARLNGVSLECRVGPLFAGAEGKFDAILANLPNDIVAPEYLATLPPADAQIFAGGEGGNTHLLALLEAAPSHMHAGSRLYLGAHAITDFHGTLRAALERYSVRLLGFRQLPVKDFVTTSLSYYQELARTGVIELFQDADGRWYSYGYMFELRLPLPI